MFKILVACTLAIALAGCSTHRVAKVRCTDRLEPINVLPKADAKSAGLAQRKEARPENGVPSDAQPAVAGGSPPDASR